MKRTVSRTKRAQLLPTIAQVAAILSAGALASIPGEASAATAPTADAGPDAAVDTIDDAGVGDAMTDGGPAISCPHPNDQFLGGVAPYPPPLPAGSGCCGGHPDTSNMAQRRGEGLLAAAVGVAVVTTRRRRRKKK